MSSGEVVSSDSITTDGPYEELRLADLRHLHGQFRPDVPDSDQSCQYRASGTGWLAAL